ncbi:MAG: RNA polymerase subunit sigma-54 [Deltaproteobacteria bacterium]|nr:MAG: RNA polymerase subunit sigma-54 [Deltaproteobacteria bacterium]
MLDLIEQRYPSASDRNRAGRTVAACADIIGESEAVQRVVGVVGKVAKTDSTVLISGESGTGKELIARAIHESSPRVNGRLVILNCGAIPGELLESELFGHEKGAFTGAHRTRVGRFELADGGTLFLDEIGDMRPDLQVKLLRTLQEKTIERVGGNRSIPVDVRIIGATNKDLTAAISDGTFREDLYYRLNVIPIHVPPLRERKTDIPLLVDFFQKRLAERMREPVKPLTPDAMATLQAYAWPGNIRELENLMERLGVLVDGDTIRTEDLPDVISGMPSVREGADQISEFLDSGLGFNDVVDLLQKRLILTALKQTGWVKAKAAEKLQMNRTTLVEKIKKLKIEAACADRPVF